MKVVSKSRRKHHTVRQKYICLCPSTARRVRLAFACQPHLSVSAAASVIFAYKCSPSSKSIMKVSVICSLTVCVLHDHRVCVYPLQRHFSLTLSNCSLVCVCTLLARALQAPTQARRAAYLADRRTANLAKRNVNTSVPQTSGRSRTDSKV